jgi:hypothetical protein
VPRLPSGGDFRILVVSRFVMRAKLQRFRQTRGRLSASCPPGFFQLLGGKDNCLRCDKGHFCENGVMTPCPIGTVCAEAGFSSPTTCHTSDGLFCPAAGALVAQECPPMHACSNGDAKPQPCKENEVSMQARCVSCLTQRPGLICRATLIWCRGIYRTNTSPWVGRVARGQGLCGRS